MSRYLIGAATLILLAVGGVVVWQGSATAGADIGARTETQARTPEVAPTGVTHDVVLTPDGYQPDELSIQLGDEVVFSASDTYGRPHWPASDVHPTHEIYAALDPQEPVAPVASWSFVFDQAGEWRFHDHLAPYFTGTITVHE